MAMVGNAVFTAWSTIADNVTLVGTVELTFVEIKNCQGDFVSPRGSLLKAYPIATSAEEVSGCDEVTVPGGLKFKTRTIPDESFESAKKLQT
jgi:hypothetical protein